MKKNKFGFLLFLPLLVLWTVFHYRILFLGQAYAWMDCTRFYFPVWKWGGDVWKQGLIPLWNPDAGFGTPWMADPQTLSWYPPMAVCYSLFSSVVAFNILLLAHHLWLLAGTWFLARARGLSDPGALLACLIVGFSFDTVCLLGVPTLLFTFSWLPWILLASQRLKENKPGSFLYFSAALSLQLAAGFPIIFYLTFLIVLLEGLGGFLASPPYKKKFPIFWKKMALFQGAVSLALLYNSAWLFPFFEFSPGSNIGKRLEIGGEGGWSNLFTWLNPFYLGHPLYSHPETPLSASGYFAGLPAVVLVLWGGTKRKMDRVSMILFFLFLILSLGKTGYLGSWLKLFLPGYDWVARGGYWIPPVTLMLALLAAQSADQFLSKPRRNEKIDFLWLALSVGVFIAAIFLGVPVSLSALWLFLLFIILAGLPVFFSPGWRWSFLLMALFFSLGPVVKSFNFSMDGLFFEEKPELAEKIKEPGRIYHSPALVERFRTVSGNSVADVYGRLKGGLLPNWPLAFHLEEICFSDTIFLNSFLRWYYAPTVVSPAASAKILNYLDARYILDVPSPEAREKLTALRENDSALGKWFSIKRAVPETDWANDLAKIKGTSFSFSDLCFISNPLEAGPYQRRQVDELNRAPNAVTLQAAGPGEALLVSSETAFPGWIGVVDGKKRVLEEVNHGFRGVRLMEGERVVVIAYQPASFRFGFFLSLLALGSWSALLLKHVLLIRKVPDA